MRRFLLALLCLVPYAAFGAPADDGQTAGARNWTLNQARSSVTITPDDANDLAIAPTRALYVGADGAGSTTACDVTARMADDGTTSTLFKNMAPGQWYPYQIKRVLSTGTTCTQLRALY